MAALVVKMAPKVSQTASKGPLREPEKEVKREPSGVKGQQTGTKREPTGAKRGPKVSQGAIKMHPKTGLGARVGSESSKSGLHLNSAGAFWDHFASKICVFHWKMWYF